MTDYSAALCRDADPTTFDPPRPGELALNAHLRIARAQTLCRRCPTAITCLTDAFTNNDSGVRGGLLLHNGNPVELPRGTSPKPKLAPCGTHAAYNRHLARGEDVDVRCQAGERLYQARRYQARKRRAA